MSTGEKFKNFWPKKDIKNQGNIFSQKGQFYYLGKFFSQN
jgi:hypothetical protein